MARAVTNTYFILTMISWLLCVPLNVCPKNVQTLYWFIRSCIEKLPVPSVGFLPIAASNFVGVVPFVFIFDLLDVLSFLRTQLTILNSLIRFVAVSCVNCVLLFRFKIRIQDNERDSLPQNIQNI